MGKEVFHFDKRKLRNILIVLPLMLFALLYGGGYIAQFMRNYADWKNAGHAPGDGHAIFSDCRLF